MRTGHAETHAQFTMIAARLLECSEQFARIGEQLGQLCHAVDRLIEVEYGEGRRDGT